MLLKRGDTKKRAADAAHAVRARGGFGGIYTYTPQTLSEKNVFVIDDARLDGEVDESGRVVLCSEMVFSAYILVALDTDPCEHDFELVEKAVDEMLDDLAGQLKGQNLRLVLPVEYRTRKVRNSDERNPGYTSYSTAEFKLR